MASFDLDELQDRLQEMTASVVDYFSHLTLYQQIAWGLIGLGLLLILVGLLL